MTREQAFVTAFYRGHLLTRTDRCDGWPLCPILGAYLRVNGYV